MNQFNVWLYSKDDKEYTFCTNIPSNEKNFWGWMVNNLGIYRMPNFIKLEQKYLKGYVQKEPELSIFQKQSIIRDCFNFHEVKL